MTIWKKGYYPNFTIPTGGPKITEILKGIQWTHVNWYYRVLLVHTYKHTNIHTCTNTWQVKLLSSAKLNFKYLPLIYEKNAGIAEFTEFNTKQVANRPAHLPRVQAPVHMLDGAPGVHHRRRPQGMTKMTQNTLNYF